MAMAASTSYALRLIVIGSQRLLCRLFSALRLVVVRPTPRYDVRVPYEELIDTKALAAGLPSPRQPLDLAVGMSRGERDESRINCVPEHGGAKGA